MAITGKTGADAIFKDLKHSCRIITKYSTKLTDVIVLAQAAGVITPAESATITAFIATANALCTAFDKLASYSGF